MDALAALRREPGVTALFLDFDGTLAPIVAHPSDARPHPDAAALLVALAERYAVVAVVSGRPVAFLDQHLPPGIERHGLYGIEAVIDGAPVVRADAQRWREVVEEVAESARTDGPSGLDVEPKGLSLTLHYRRRPPLAEEAERWAVAAAARSGLELRRAKMSLELHPPVAVDKGTVVEARAAGMDAIAYIGDDVGDLPAFDALDRLATAGTATVKVAVHTPDVSAELLARADLEVDGTDGVLALLRQLL